MFSAISLYLTQTHLPEYEILKDLLVGILSSVILLILFEWRDYRRDDKEYGYLQGDYKREARFKANTDKKINTKWEEVTSPDNPNLKLIYAGSRQYHIPKIHYDEQWTATATIFLDATNKKSGAGIYQYTKKHPNIKVDLGTYKLFVDELDNRRLYVFHQNYLPSGLSIGYEIWVRQTP